MSGKDEGKLSSKVTSMRFMQRKLAADAEQKKLERVFDEVVVMTDSGGERKISVVVADGHGDPIIQYCPGRRSFGKFNEHVQEAAVAQMKEYKKFLKQAGGQAKQIWTGGGGAPPQVGKVQEGMDVDDKEMAAALGKGKRDLGQGTGEIPGKSSNTKSGGGASKKHKKQ